MIIIQLLSIDKMRFLSIYWIKFIISFNFEYRKTVEKAQILIPKYGKMVGIKFYSVEKCFFCYFHTYTFTLWIVWKCMISVFFSYIKNVWSAFLSTRETNEKLIFQQIIILRNFVFVSDNATLSSNGRHGAD